MGWSISLGRVLHLTFFLIWLGAIAYAQGGPAAAAGMIAAARNLARAEAYPFPVERQLMSIQSNAAYFLARAIEERESSRAAADSCAAAAHKELADRYERIAAELGAKRPTLHISAGQPQIDMPVAS